MKRIIALAFCLLFILTACSGKTEKKTELNEDNYASYVGAGEMTLINILINSNGEFANNVFGSNHLPVDETKIITNTEGSFAPVVSDKYKTLDDLRSHLYSTYIQKTADSLLTSPAKYVDIDGKLYMNMKYADKNTANDWSAPEVSATIDAEGRYIISVTVKNEKGRKTEIEASAVTENGSLKLENIYY